MVALAWHRPEQSLAGNTASSFIEEVEPSLELVLADIAQQLVVNILGRAQNLGRIVTVGLLIDRRHSRLRVQQIGRQVGRIVSDLLQQLLANQVSSSCGSKPSSRAGASRRLASHGLRPPGWETIRGAIRAQRATGPAMIVILERRRRAVSPASGHDELRSGQLSK